MYYSYVEFEYVATSFSPARTDLALKLLTTCWFSSRVIHIRYTIRNPPNKRTAKPRRCSMAFPLVYALRVLCAPSAMGWRNVRRHCAMPRSLQSRPTWIVIIFPSQSWMDILSRSLPPKQPVIQKVGNIHLIHSLSSRRMAARYLSSNTTRLTTAGWHRYGIYLSIPGS